MGGGDLNTKKAWHPSTLKNQERVWKAEQAAAAEQKRILELQRERAQERDREDLNKLARQNSDVIAGTSDNRLSWMYDQKPDKRIQQEDYLLGKAIDKNYDNAGKCDQNEIPAVSRRVVGSSMITTGGDTQVDLTRKLREDPLLLVKERERAARAALLNNPVQRKKLTELLRKEQEQKNQLKSEKKSKKKKKDLDDLLAAKLSALGGEKGMNIAKLLESSNDSESDSSSEEEKSKKKKKKKKSKSKKRKRNVDSESPVKSKKSKKSKSSSKKHDDEDNASETEASRNRKSEFKKHKKCLPTNTKTNRDDRYDSDDDKSFHKEERRDHSYHSKSSEKQQRGRESSSNRKERHKMRCSESSSDEKGRTEQRHFSESIPDRQRKEKQQIGHGESSINRKEAAKRGINSEIRKAGDRVEYRPEKKRSGLSEEEINARLAAMAAAGAEREVQRGRRVAAQLAENAAAEKSVPRHSSRNEARVLPDSLESRIHSNRHYIQRDQRHMNEHFARR
ncbi:pre-mRNA-splicing factor CWC25 homolog isoform X2 [Pararge aegeria]|uniref:Jg7183 protein n=2 Tax=Pararge aegeria TaxID=116150 RepID=A0A8S4RAT6_9NEOP|nr:pre-mRNA-splicing factor CWC25 homolog isoform X2 [Pararge aegeria]CAH2231770.1 jg7183 [Pararge aegeria aegeria]